jgi:hypothetical protein
MRSKIRIILIVGAIVALGLNIRAYMHSRTVKAQSSSLIPFTFSYRNTIDNPEKPGDHIRVDLIKAVSSDGTQMLWDTRYMSDSSAAPEFIRKLVETPQISTEISWSIYRQALGQRSFYLSEPTQGVHHYAVPENNCLVGAKGESLLRNETLTIGAEQVETVVVGYESVGTVEWKALTPGLGCLAVKQVRDRTTNGVPDRLRMDPISLKFGDPDPEMMRTFNLELANAENAGTRSNYLAQIRNWKHDKMLAERSGVALP